MTTPFSSFQKKPTLWSSVIALASCLAITLLILHNIAPIFIIGTLLLSLTSIIYCQCTKPCSKPAAIKPIKNPLPPSKIASKKPIIEVKVEVKKDINPEIFILATLKKAVLEMFILDPKFKKASKAPLIKGLISLLSASSPVIHYFFLPRSVKDFLSSLYQKVPQVRSEIKNYHPQVSFDEEKAYALKAVQALQTDLGLEPSLAALQKELDKAQADLIKPLAKVDGQKAPLSLKARKSI